VRRVQLEISAALAAAFALGAMVFFSFVMAPLVFAKLPRETAGAFMRAAFPVYYLVLAGLAALSAALAATRPEALALWLAALLFVGMRFWLVPALDRVRGKDEAAFARLHRLSVVVNLVQMILLAGAALRLAG
jgi:hypothetical protein